VRPAWQRERERERERRGGENPGEGEKAAGSVAIKIIPG